MDIVVRAPDDHRESALEPDSVLPCQLGDPLLDGARLQPEKRLQLAVLQDAILTFRRWVGVEGQRPRRLFAEVDAWFASDETDGPFTFATICHTLNLEPDYIRRGLGRWRAGTTARRAVLFRREAGGTRHQVLPPRLRRIA